MRAKNAGRHYHDHHEQRQPHALHVVSPTRRLSYGGAGRDGPRGECCLARAPCRRAEARALAAPSRQDELRRPTPRGDRYQAEAAARRSPCRMAIGVSSRMEVSSDGIAAALPGMQKRGRSRSRAGGRLVLVHSERLGRRGRHACFHVAGESAGAAGALRADLYGVLCRRARW